MSSTWAETDGCAPSWSPLSTRTGVVGTLALAWTPDNADRFHEVVDARPCPPASRNRPHGPPGHLRSRAAEKRLAVFEDRDRIGRDLHDLVIQRLFAVGLSLQGASQPGQTNSPRSREAHRVPAVDDLDATIKDIRGRSSPWGHWGMADMQAEVTRLVDRAAATLKFRPVLQFEGAFRSLIPDDMAPDLLAVLGEALSNAVPAHRGHQDRGVARVGDEIKLSVVDDGRGIAETCRERAGQHSGACPQAWGQARRALRPGRRHHHHLDRPDLTLPVHPPCRRGDVPGEGVTFCTDGTWAGARRMKVRVTDSSGIAPLRGPGGPLTNRGQEALPPAIIRMLDWSSKGALQSFARSREVPVHGSRA